MWDASSSSSLVSLAVSKEPILMLGCKGKKDPWKSVIGISFCTCTLLFVLLYLWLQESICSSWLCFFVVCYWVHTHPASRAISYCCLKRALLSCGVSYPLLCSAPLGNTPKGYHFLYGCNIMVFIVLEGWGYHLFIKIPIVSSTVHTVPVARQKASAFRAAATAHNLYI